MEQTKRILKVSDLTAHQLHGCEIYNNYTDIVHILLQWILSTSANCITIRMDEREITIQFNKIGFEAEVLKQKFDFSQQSDLNQMVKWRMLPYLKSVCQISILTSSTEGKVYSLNVNTMQTNYVTKKIINTTTKITIKQFFANFPIRQKVMNFQKELKSIRLLITQLSIVFHRIKFFLIHDGNVLIESISQSDEPFFGSTLNQICCLYTSLQKQNLLVSMNDDISLITLKSDHKIIKPRCWLIAVNGQLFDIPIEIEKILRKYPQTKMLAILFLKFQKNNYQTYKRDLWIYDIQRIQDQLTAITDKLFSRKIAPQPLEEQVLDRQITRKRIGKIKQSLSLYNQIEAQPENEATRIKKQKQEIFQQAKYVKQQQRLNKKQRLMKQAKTQVKEIQQRTCHEQQQTQLSCYSQQDTCSLTYNKISQMLCIGQFAKGFVIGQINNSLFIIDQHAASEKVLYEKYLNQSQVTAKNQFTIRLSKEYLIILQERSDQLRGLGWQFIISEVNERYIILNFTQTPKKCDYIYAQSEFFETLELLAKNSHLQLSRINKIMATKACGQAFRVGQFLDEQKMKSILKALSQLQSPWNCPHGRPTIFQIGKIQDYCCKIKSIKTYSLQ